MSISFPSADFAPTLSGYTGQGAFRFWCQKVLPIVYDDSLSYYELLAKVVDYLNKAIQDVANVENKIEGLVEAYSELENFTNEQLEAIENAFNELQTFVDTYFDNLDVQGEINSKLDQMARNGDLNALIEPVIREIAPDILTDWMDEHITPTTPVIDSTLSIAGAGADAKATGDAIAKLESHSGYAVDGYGSVFANQNELYLHNLKYENRPDYEFNFDDIAEERLTAYGQLVHNGISNNNHLIEYDDSMVLTVNLTEHTDPISLTIALITIEDDFVNVLNITTYNFPDNVTKRLNLRRLKNWSDPSIKAYLHLGSPSTDKDILRKWCKVNRNNVNNTICYPLMHMLNDPTIINSFHTNSNRVPTYFSDSTMKYVRGGWKYFYAYGNPIDAEFYDANGNVVVASKHGLGAYQPNELYDTCIEIPANAYTYKIAIYGLVQFSSSVWGLGNYMMETYFKCGAYGDPIRGLANGLYLGRVISNAYKLSNYKYPGRGINMRNYLLNANTSDSSKVVGFPYGKRTPNYSISYYSYLTMVAKGRGYNISVHPTGSDNYYIGFVCTTFLGECMGINDPYQGTEWWIQNYSDRFEEVNLDTELLPGDLIISTKYRRYSPSNPVFTLNTHLSLVVDVMSDKNDGLFGGYLIFEESNCWNQISVDTNANLISTVTERDLDIDPLTQAKTWRVRMPLTSIPVFGTKYNFNIDRELDILNHPENLPDRAIVGPSGDMSLISPKGSESRNGWGAVASFYYLYADKTISRIDVYKDGEFLGYMTAENALESTTCYVFDFSEYVDTEGDKVYTFVPDNNTNQTCTLYAPAFPVATSSQDGKTATIEGIRSEIVDGNLHLYTDSFDKLYFRVIPFPVEDINGFKPRFANYINIKAEEIWDGTKFDVGDRYDYIVAVTGVNSTYGGAMKWFRGDHSIDSTRDEDDPVGDDRDADNP